MHAPSDQHPPPVRYLGQQSGVFRVLGKSCLQPQVRLGVLLFLQVRLIAPKIVLGHLEVGPLQRLPDFGVVRVVHMRDAVLNRGFLPAALRFPLLSLVVVVGTAREQGGEQSQS